MSEEILKALTQLFAIISKQDDGVTEEERNYVIRFFQQEWRPKILALMESLREGRNLFVFTNPDALQDFLAENFAT